MQHRAAPLLVASAVSTDRGTRTTLDGEPGQPIQFILIVTNTGSEQWYVTWGADPQNAFVVTPGACTDVNDPACDWLYLYPQVIYWFSQGTLLDPGECRTWTHTAQFDLVYPPLCEGMYRAFGAMAAMLFAEEGNTVLWQVPADALTLTILVESAIPVDDTTWGRIKALYR